MANTSLDAVVVAGASSATMGFAEEVSYGKTPPSPVLKRQRIVSTTLSPSVEMYSSNEPTRDRQGSAPRHGIRRVGSDIVIDLSPSSHQAEYEALLGGYWQTPVPVDIATVNLTATLTSDDALDITATSFDFIAAGLFVGTPVTFTGANAALNGIKFTVTGHDANKITLLPPPDFTLSGSPVSLTTGTFGMKGARLGMGTIMRSFVNERAFEDMGKFWVFNGILYNTFSAELPTTGVATGTFGVVGQAAASLSSASIDGVAEVTLDDTDCGQLVFDRAAGTITRQSGSWIADGFEPGDKAQFTGEGITEVQNRQIRTVIAVSAFALTVEEAIADGTYTDDYYVLKVGMPEYTEASEHDVLVSVSGDMVIDGERAGVITGMTFSVDNQIDGSPVVGSNSIPFYAWGVKAMVSVNPTVYFTRGGAGETMLNAALTEADVSFIVNLDTRDGDDSLSVVFNRVVFAPGQFSNEGSSISLSMEGEAAKPLSTSPGLGDSKIYIFDTTITGVEPPVDTLTLTFVSEAAGVATFTVSGGVAPYVFDGDDGGSTVVVPTAGTFTHDYTLAGNATYDPTVTDSASTPNVATYETVITTV